MSRSCNWSFIPFPFVRQKSTRDDNPGLKQKIIDVNTMSDRREEQEQEAREIDLLLKEIEVVRDPAEERHAEKAEELVELEGLLHEIHQSRIAYIRELTIEKRNEIKEERLKERKAKRERRETELQRIARQQRRFIKSQARVMRALQKERIQEAKRQEEAEGWKVVTYKKIREPKTKSRRSAH
jgi:hypothetical protein